MRKIPYNEPKINDLLVLLKDLNYEFTKEKDSIEVKTISKSCKKQLAHELSKLNAEYKAIPLALSHNETDGIISVFDGRP